MSTLRQAAIDRVNKRQSNGQTPAEQKARARRFLLEQELATHGIILPDETKDQIQAQISVWSQGYKGWDERDQYMIEQAAVEYLRVIDCQRQETHLRIKQCRRAYTHWDVNRRADARALFNRLHRNPLVNSSKLESTLRGAELMIERWDQLLSLLETGKPWDEKHRSHALDLLGIPNDIRDARMKIDARHGESAHPIQKKIAESEVRRLKAIKEAYLIPDDEEARDETMAGLGVIDPPTRAIRRYESECKKHFHVALKWLDGSRRRSGKPTPKAYGGPDGDTLSRHNMEKQSLENMVFRAEVPVPVTVAPLPVPVQPVAPISEPIALVTPVPTVTPVGEMMTKSLRKEPPVVVEIDERERRARRPDPAKILRQDA